MDKKSLIGLLIIGVILFGFAWYNGSQQKKYAEQKAIIDSINLANKIEQFNEGLDAQPSVPNNNLSDSTAVAQEAAKEQYFGEYLYNATQGTETFYTIENDLIKMVLSNKGGRVATVELKDYKKYNGEPLLLFAENSSKFDLSFYIKRQYNDMQLKTADYYFTPVDPSTNVVLGENDTEKTFAFRLNIDSLSYVEYLYTVYKDNYMVDFDVRFVNMENVLSSNQRDLSVIWENTSYQNEKGFDNENRYTTIAYNYPDEKSIEELGISTEGKSETINSKMKWVAFKQQFFSSVFISDDTFQNGTIEYTTHKPEEEYIKNFIATLSVPFTPQTTDCSFQYYFGPNKFSVLKKYDMHLERLVPLGGWIVGWINRLIVIPTFDILGKFISNYGIIILIMTIIIKIIISPLTYKSYLSSAKMRLLKPDIDKLNEKYPKPDDALKKQQAMMELYRTAGANPMGGCLPLLIQFPILIAMFRFFPASIELRGQHFLWADDLSSYDSILNLPFNIPFYGAHVSLFALLMAVSVYVSARINYNQTAASGPQMAGMKFMMLYLMPLMLLFWFNNYSSGLSYYYLLSNIITIGQTYAFRYAVNDQKLHQKMKENAKKPKKKSKWQQRYDEMLKAQQQQMKSRR